MSTREEYAEFLHAKSHLDSNDGFDPVFLPDFLFPFQRSLVEWAVRKGRAAIFADCGLGKTPMQLTWAENVVRHTNGRVLILTPLAVSYQTRLEAEKFGFDLGRIDVANYERLHHYDPSDYAGVVCDESSILKSFDGKRRLAVTDFMRKARYRLLCTATAAPNDYIELGTSSEALGYLGHTDMLNRFFKNDQNNSATGRLYGEAMKWRFKGHAETPFWRWVCSWARAVRRPSDLGFADEGFILPPLIERDHVVQSETIAPGMLFSVVARGLAEQREERRRTVGERCEKVAALVADTGQPALVWCHLNVEGDRLTAAIPGAVQVSGSDSEEKKEATFLAFSRGEIRVLVTKPKCGAWGLNFQHCAHVTFFPSHSFEQYYQGVRRCWRFGQTRPVTVDVVTTEGEREVMANLQRKARAADSMFSALVEEMNRAISVDRAKTVVRKEEVPSWILS